MNTIPDIQSTRDLRQMPINQVGIKDLHFPIRVQSANGIQHTVAKLSMTVSLPAEQKGTHMSRFVALMEEYDDVINFTKLNQLTTAMLERLQSHSGKIHLHFPFFRQKTAPVTGMKSLLDYHVQLSSEINHQQTTNVLKILVPVTTLCPCSKEISQYGAHNQRSHVTATLHCNEDIDIDQIIGLIEHQASCQLYGLLKRPDEKFVTERAYENPKFVEDIVRDVALVLRQDQRIHRFEVESENFESIHNHSAYAYISYP